MTKPLAASIAALLLLSGVSQASDAHAVFRAFRERRAEDKIAAVKEKAAIEAHLRKIESFKAGLTLPKDAAADQVAENALLKDREALRKLAERLKLSSDAIESRALMIPENVVGTVRKKSGADWVQIGPDTPILPGDTVSAGPDSTVDFQLEDGTRLRLYPNSTYTRSADEQLLNELQEGRITVRHLGAAYRKGQEPKFVAGVIVVAVRGTDFDLALDEDKLPRLALREGRVVTSEKGALDRSALKRWWAGLGAPKPALPAGQALRVDALSGSASAKEGALLPAGEELALDAQARAEVTLRDGYRAVLGPGSRLKAGKADYRLSAGGAYVLGQPGKRAAFLTPLISAALTGAEFEVSVDSSGAAEWLPLAGTLDLSPSTR